jgi:hypothetical protein
MPCIPQIETRLPPNRAAQGKSEYDCNDADQKPLSCHPETGVVQRSKTNTSICIQISDANVL